MSDVIARIEFKLFRQKLDQMAIGRIAEDRKQRSITLASIERTTMLQVLRQTYNGL
jgi:hypothetical protein